MGVAATGLISLDEAWRRIAAAATPGATCWVSRAEAHGRVLAEPLAARLDHPPFDRAMMDGYAVRAADTRAAPCELRVVGESLAGHAPMRSAGGGGAAHIGPGEAMIINTGAALPGGADAVVQVERTRAIGGGRVRIDAAVDTGRSVAPRGSIRASGQLLLAAPVRIGAAQLAAMASDGVAEVRVFAQPRIAAVITGDELAPIGGAMEATQIFDANGPALTALARECDAPLASIGYARDDAAELRRSLEHALSADMVIVSGGMSKGTRDLAPGVLETLGVRWEFHGVDMRPGRPTAFGRGPSGQLVFGLPGNPVSCLVCFLAFVAPAIRGRTGLPARPAWRSARLGAAGLPAHRDARPAFIPAVVEMNAAGDAIARPTEWRGSGDPFGAAAGNGFLFQPRGDAVLPAGSPVRVLALPGADEGVPSIRSDLRPGGAD